jgi:large subunit ribosomal protein L25
MTHTLAVTARATGAKSDVPAGTIPGVVYGPKQEAIALSFNQQVFEKLFHEAGESTIINLEGLGGEPIEVLVHEVAFNPVRGGVQHVDFYAIERGKELTTNVALQFEGEPPALKQGGVLTKALQEVTVTCRPSKLPAHITVDVSALVDFEAQIRVKDLPVDEGVKIDTDAEEVVAVVVPVQEEVEEAPAEVDMDAIEVEEKGKGEEAAPASEE